MNTRRHRRAHSLDNQPQRFQQKMADLFDSSAGLTCSNKLLADNPYLDGLSLSRSLSDMPMSPYSSSKNQMNDKKKSLWTPMKALIAEEMSMDIETRHLHPNVVAKLMGLEAFPQKKPHLCDQKKKSRTYLDINHAPMKVQNKLPIFHQSKNYTGLHEILQQSDDPNVMREHPLQNGRQDRSKHEKKMALVRQKFMEAKRLVTDEKLRHTKEFRDALEVLSLNRESFLSFLQEPNSLFSGNLCELQSLPREAKRITILRPSKMVDHGNQNVKLMKQPSLVAELTRLNGDDAEYVCVGADKDRKDCPPQPTRIVVLKPSSGKIDEMKTSSSSCNEDANRDGKLESEGDIITFYKSEGEAIGNLSDSEVMSPPSRHSCDFINMVGSPYSISSFSRASYSPESLVYREAKRRLSERWALMASHETSSEQRHVRKDSSTLGEILVALLDANVEKCKERQLNGSPYWSMSDSNKGETLVDLPKSLMRSKSLPASSSMYSDSLHVESVDLRKGKSDVQKAAAKNGSNANPSSFKGKVSSLFSFMSRKSKKEASGTPQHEDKIQSSAVDSLEDLMANKNCNDISCSSPPEDVDEHHNGGTIANGVGMSGSMSALTDSKGNQDQPSPISVFYPSFEEDESLTSESSSGDQGPVLSLGFNLIDKSPPIGSIARTLSWDDGINNAATPYFSKSPAVSFVMEDWLTFVRKLLSEAGFDGQLSLDSFISRWYSSESPLDPSLRKKFANVKDKGVIMPEAKRRQKMSERQLAYDCVNISLVKIGDLLDGSYVETRRGDEPATFSRIEDLVWTQMKQWLSDEVRCVTKDDGDRDRDRDRDRDSLVVEKVVRNEVVRKGWFDHLGNEKDCLGKSIELKLLDELVYEAVTDLIGSFSL